MRLTTTTIILAAGSALLIWSGLTDRNPVDVLKAIFTGGEVPAKGSWSKQWENRGASGESNNGGGVTI